MYGFKKTIAYQCTKKLFQVVDFVGVSLFGVSITILTTRAVQLNTNKSLYKRFQRLPVLWIVSDITAESHSSLRIRCQQSALHSLAMDCTLAPPFASSSYSHIHHRASKYTRVARGSNVIVSKQRPLLLVPGWMTTRVHNGNYHKYHYYLLLSHLADRIKCNDYTWSYYIETPSRVLSTIEVCNIFGVVVQTGTVVCTENTHHDRLYTFIL